MSTMEKFDEHDRNYHVQEHKFGIATAKNGD